MLLTVMFLGSIFVMRNSSLSFTRVFFILKNLWFDHRMTTALSLAFLEFQVTTFGSTSSGIVLTSHCILLSKVLVCNSNNNSK